jgi:aminopeptidase N
MKRITVSLFLLVMITVNLNAQIDAKSSGAYRCSLKKSSMKRLPLIPGSTNSAGPHSFDVLKYTLNLDIWHCFQTPYHKDYTASVKIQFRADSLISNLILNASVFSLQIDSVRLAGVGFTRSGDILSIALDQSYSAGQIAEVMIYYHHNNVVDNAFNVSGGMVFTDCEPEGARHWFPCWDSPSDKALLELTAKVPANVKLGSNGRLADSTLTADTLYYHWISADNVATYLVVMSSKVNYKLDIIYWHKLSNPSDSIPIRFYYNPNEDPSNIESIIDSMTTYYSRNWCEHPFEKNGFATLNNLFAWGGMENQTLTSLCPGCWDVDMVSHEFSHQWYGDMITCATWADIWLNEGFATWSEGFWVESSGGYTDYLQKMQYFASQYLAGNPGWPISIPDWAIHTPSVDTLFDWEITYCKGAGVLHQLRYVLGDSLFFRVLQTYCADTNYKFKSATISDFNQEVNTVTGRDYGWFFNEWIYEPNHPVYYNTYDFKNLGGGNWQVDFYARQTQTNPPFFKMPLEVKIQFTDNSDTLIRVSNDFNGQAYLWVFNKEPQTFTFDPDDEIVLKRSTTIVGVPEKKDQSGMTLDQNSPNPASAQTRISFTLDRPMEIRLDILNPLGIVVMQPLSGNLETGSHSVEVNCSVLPSGVYFYRLRSENVNCMKKMVISK